jgi:hypothetical protein
MPVSSRKARWTSDQLLGHRSGSTGFRHRRQSEQRRGLSIPASRRRRRARSRTAKEVGDHVLGVSATAQRGDLHEVLDQPVLPAIGDLESGRFRQRHGTGMGPQWEGDGARLGDNRAVVPAIRGNPNAFPGGEVERHSVVDAHVRCAGANPDQQRADGRSCRIRPCSRNRRRVARAIGERG